MQDNSGQISALDELDVVYHNLYMVIEQYNSPKNFAFIY
jgi:hypothetical protein